MNKDENILRLQQELKKFNKIVIWGLRKKYHTHRHIHQGFYETLKKIGAKVVWVEDEQENAKFIESNDLVISAEVYGKMVPQKNSLADYSLPIRDDVFYCLHNYKPVFYEKLKKENLLHLQVYSSNAEKLTTKIDSVTFFDESLRILYQPWGTSLLPAEFKKPTFSKSPFVFWVGSVWNDKNNHGNLNEIAELKEVLKKNNLKFVKVRFVPDWVNTFLVRRSRIAPAIAGRIQVEINYLPCRMFKNISYGQLGISNVKKFNEIFVGCSLEGNSIEELIDKSLSLSKKEYLEMVRLQQEIVFNHTYIQKLLNIVSFLK